MSANDSQGDKSPETAEVQTTDVNTIGPFKVPESDQTVEDLLESSDVDISGEMSRIDPIDVGGDGEEDEPERDWSSATVVRDPSGMHRIDFST